MIEPIRTQSEVAKIMTERGHPLSRERVQQIEKRAIEKLSKDSELAKLAREYFESQK